MGGRPISFVEKRCGRLSPRGNYNEVLFLYTLLSGKLVCPKMLKKH